MSDSWVPWLQQGYGGSGGGLNISTRPNDGRFGGGMTSTGVAPWLTQNTFMLQAPPAFDPAAEAGATGATGAATTGAAPAGLRLPTISDWTTYYATGKFPTGVVHPNSAEGKALASGQSIPAQGGAEPEVDRRAERQRRDAEAARAAAQGQAPVKESPNTTVVGSTGGQAGTMEPPPGRGQARNAPVADAWDSRDPNYAIESPWNERKTARMEERFGDANGVFTAQDASAIADVMERKAARSAAPAPSPGGYGAPSGVIDDPRLQVAYGIGGSWDEVNEHDPQILAAAERHGVDPAMLKAMMVIESGGISGIPNQNGYSAVGLMQVKPDIHQPYASALGYDLRTDEGQIGYAAALLGGQTPLTQGMSPEEAFLQVYYPTGGLDVPGEDGHTPRQYLNDMHVLMEVINQSGIANSQPPQDRGARAVRDASTVRDGEFVPIDETVNTGSIAGNALIDYARQFVGYTYTLGAPGVSGPTQDRNAAPSTFDCSSFVQWLYYHSTGKVLPRVTFDQINEGQPVEMDQLQVGDVLFFDTYTGDGRSDQGAAGSWDIDTTPETPEHVGIYIGNGQFIHAMNPDDGVGISELNDYWLSGSMGARRLDW